MPKIQAGEITTLANLDLLHRYAMRIHSLSEAMGLDEPDEQLLWNFLAVAGLERIEADCAHIALSLLKYGSGEGVLLKQLTYSMTMDARFDRRSALKKWLWPLEIRGVVELNQVVIVGSEGDQVFLKDVVEDLKTKAFTQWYPHLQSIQRENGVDWNPPTTEDINVVTRCTMQRLVPAQASRLTLTLMSNGPEMSIR